MKMEENGQDKKYHNGHICVLWNALSLISDEASTVSLTPNVSAYYSVCLQLSTHGLLPSPNNLNIGHQIVHPRHLSPCCQNKYPSDSKHRNKKLGDMYYRVLNLMFSILLYRPCQRNICSLTCFEKKKTCINLISNGSFNDKSNSFKNKICFYTIKHVWKGRQPILITMVNVNNTMLIVQMLLKLMLFSSFLSPQWYD